MHDAEVRRKRNAIERLFVSERRKLISLALRIVHDPDLAEDAVGDASVRCWNGAGRLNSIDDIVIKKWVRIVVRNAALNLRERRPLDLLDDGDQEEAAEDRIPDPGPAVEQIVAAHLSDEELRERVQTALKLCRNDHQRAVLLHLRGFRYADAADILGITEEAYRSLLSRARQRLSGIGRTMR